MNFNTQYFQINNHIFLFFYEYIVFYVNSEGVCLEGDCFCVGSGSNFAYSILDNYELKKLYIKEAKEVAKWAIRHATYRDAYSGGYINIFQIDKNGCKHIERIDSKSIEMSLK